MEVLPSLYMLDDSQLLEEANLIQHEYAFFALRPGYLNNLLSSSAVRDAWIFYYYEDPPFINSELSLIYPVRQLFLQVITIEPRLRRLKGMTVGNFENAMYAAVCSVNIMLDIYSEAFKTLDFKTQQLLKDCYSIDTRLLFDQSYQVFETYPKSMMRAQSHMVKLMQVHIYQNAESFNESVTKTVKFIGNLNFLGKEIFL